MGECEDAIASEGVCYSLEHVAELHICSKQLTKQLIKYVHELTCALARRGLSKVEGPLK